MKRLLCLLLLVFLVTPAYGETLLFASDLHLGDETPGAQALLQELLEAGGEIDAVLLLGDMTNNGRPAERARLLELLEDASGASVLLLPGNHDLTNQTSAEFARDFAAFGWDQALSVEPATRSYAVRVTDALWVAMLNTCTETPEGAQPGGQIGDALLDWARGVLRLADEAGARVLFCGHHPLLTHSVNEEKRGDLTEGREALAALIAGSALPVYLAGHRHIAHWAQQDGLSEILAGRLGEWPLRAGRLDIAQGEAQFSVMELGTQAQRQTAEASMHVKARTMAESALASTSLAGDADMIDWFDRTYAAYVSGGLYAHRDELRLTPAFSRWQSPEITSIFRPWTAFLLDRMTEDYTALTVVLPLRLQAH